MSDFKLSRAITSSIGLAGSSVVFDLPIGKTPNIDEVVAWKVEFERSRSTNNYQIVGFQQAADGSMKAIIAKRK